MELSTASRVLDSLAEVVGAIPVAGLGLGLLLKTASQVCIAAESVNVNREGYQELAAEIAEYATAIAQTAWSDSQGSTGGPSTSDGPATQRKEIDKLTSVIQEVADVVKERQRQDAKRKGKVFGSFRRLQYDIFHKDKDEANLRALRAKVENSRKSFHINADVRGLQGIQRIENEMRASEKRQSDKIDHVEQTVVAEIRAPAVHHRQQLKQVQRVQEDEYVKRELSPVLVARFDGNGTPLGCLPQTREDLLDQLQKFTTNESESAADIFVLTGLAGTGKTTIAQSLCTHFDRQLPNASFFVSRNAADRRNPNKILQTIVYQLSVRNRAIHGFVGGALRNGRDITTRPLNEQVENLFTAPLKASSMATPRILVVIDALDECFMIGGVEGGQLIPLIVEGIRQMPGRVRLLITSREERTIMRMFEQLGIRSSIRLQKIEDTIVRTDIERYYTHHFGVISNRENYKDPWPAKDRFDLLVDRTKKLFVFAALVVRLLNDGRYDPRERLEEILSSPSGNPDDASFESLDQLYLDVLKKATEGEDGSVDKALVTRVAKVIGAIVLLQQPITPLALSELLDDKHSHISRVIQHLSAVLSIPDDIEQPSTIFHPSFADFSLFRCTNKSFKIDSSEFHGYLALRCLLIMNDRYLRYNICGIQDPSQMNADVKDLDEKRDRHLPLELRYACEYWMEHLKNTKECSDALLKAVNMFCNRHILHWIEVLSLIGKLSASHTGLPGVIKWCKAHRIAAYTLLEDADRTVQLFDPALKVAALHAYHSALTLMPNCELQRRPVNDPPSFLRLTSERFGGWSPLRLALEGCADSVVSVAFSHDSMNIASASRDHAVQIWDSISGGEPANFGGHTASATSVALSVDGNRIASGLEDETVRVWDVIDGSLTVQLRGHTDRVTSVHFSPDCMQIVSGSYDQTIRVWEIATGNTLANLQGHTGGVNSVAFSSDGKLVVSGANDNTVRIWNVASCCILAKLDGHTNHVSSVTFSPDNTQVASGSHDSTVRVWDVDRETSLIELKGHTHQVTSVAFSPDGESIASGSWDRTVRLWDVTTGKVLVNFEGHTKQVNSVVFSPDGTRIASGSADKTIRVWATSAGGAQTRFQGHTDRVSSVAFSIDGKRIASGSNDHTVRIWDAIEGRTLFNMNGHTGVVTSVVFSSDGTRIASSAHDGTARVWNVASGKEVAKLEGHGPLVSCVAFSPDGVRVATGSSDSAARVFNASTGKLLTKFEGHTSMVTSIAFSPDQKHVASAASDDAVRLWDINTGHEIVKTQMRSNQRVASIEFSKDGRSVELRDESQREMQWKLPSPLPKPDDPAASDGLGGEKASLVQVTSSRPHVEYEDGWLVVVEPSKSVRRRLCWIPPDRRPQNGSYCWLHDRVVVFAHVSGILTIMTIS